MAVNLSPVGGVAGQFFDNNGDPLVGGKLYTYAAGTTTPQATYTSSSGGTPNSNPIILNAGGRVPAEIWLTDGLVYKFVLYSSTDQLIGSWDNIVGINSNFVNFVTSEEVQIATAGQTVFTLTTMSYQPGINNLVVYVDGVNQVEGGSYSFVETNSTTVTFTSGLHLGAVVKFVSAETVTTIGSNAAQVAYEPAGSGAVTTTVQAKLRETVSVKDFGAVGDGVTDDTAAIQAAMNAAASAGLPLNFGGSVYAVSATGAYALVAPDNLTMFGVQKLTTLKLLSASVDTAIVGRATTSTYFRCEGIIFDGNKASVSAVNVSAIYFPEATTVISRNNTFSNLNDLGSFDSKAVYVSNTTLAQYAESLNDVWSGCEGNSFQTYNTVFNLVENGRASDVLISFTDINGQTIPSNTNVRTTIRNNSITCDAAFSDVYSVLSLMGNDIECSGNKIVGGGSQIYVHDGTTELLYNYAIIGNTLRNGNAGIVVVQSSGASARNGNVSVVGNSIYQAEKDSIAIIGNYAGGATTPQANVSVVGNVIYDYLTDNPAPGAFACIRTLGAVNTTITGNSIGGARWAGIYCEYDGRNIDISSNVIVDHQGRTTNGAGTSTPQAGGAIFISGGSGTAYLGNINVNGNTIRNYGTQVSPQASYVRTGGIVINEAKSQDISVRGNRVMTGNTSGISLFACVNVTVKDNEVEGFYSEALNTSSGVGAGCELAYAVSGATYAATGDRPTLQSTQAGYSMWDSTLTKPIWWDGSNWKDASNNTV